MAAASMGGWQFTATAAHPKRGGQKPIPWEQLPVEFRGGSKLAMAAGSVEPLTSGGFMYVEIDAGHGFTWGSDSINGQYTGAVYNGLPREDELNRKVALRLYNDLDTDASRAYYPAVSRWIQNNDHDAADWDYYRPTENSTQRVDSAFYDLPPYTNIPNKSLKVGYNVTSANYDRAAHANMLSEGTHTYGKILVTIHFNSQSGHDGPDIVLQNPTTGSTQAQYDISKKLGLYICDAIWSTRFSTTSQCSSRIQRQDLTVLREVFNNLSNGQPFPAVLIEVLDPSNSGDNAWLGTGSTLDSRLNMLGDAIATGVRNFYNAT